MSDDPYQAPNSNVDLKEDNQLPPEILRKIMRGWIAAIVYGAFTLGSTTYLLYFGPSSELVDKRNYLQVAISYIDIVIIFALAYGIYRRSKFASIFMLIYFIVANVILWIEAGGLQGILIFVIFLYLFFQAMLGMIEYHKLKKKP